MTEWSMAFFLFRSVAVTRSRSELDFPKGAISPLTRISMLGSSSGLPFPRPERVRTESARLRHMRLNLRGLPRGEMGSSLLFLIKLPAAVPAFRSVGVMRL
uniref:Putative secreted protein n=1 Tax=Anopheles darlingi TaxID=43151 RepID=A0A2M4DQ54_ANODA